MLRAGVEQECDLKKLVLAASLLLAAFSAASTQESRKRWERLCQIRHEKFDRILPEAMRENGIDMWITMSKEGLYDPLFRDFGEGYVGSIAYFIFTDRGAAGIERVAVGLSDRRMLASDGGSAEVIHALIVEFFDGVPRRAQDGIHQIGGRGLPVCAGDANELQLLRRPSMEVRRRS